MASVYKLIVAVDREQTDRKVDMSGRHTMTS